MTETSQLPKVAQAALREYEETLRYCWWMDRIALAAVAIIVTFAAVCGATIPSEDVTRERCDLIVLNSFYDDQARLVFDQLLFYDWSYDNGRFQLRAWRMVKSTAQHPRYDHARELWTTTWLDGEIPRQISAPVYQHVFTNFDPELTEREFLPKEQRRELRPPAMKAVNHGR